MLDDAIREHLELKRLRGADPSDVARAEQDALGPVHREQGSEPDKPPSGQTGDSSTGDGLSSSEPEPVSEPDASVSTSAHGSQETVEINMEAELARESDYEHKSGIHDDGESRPSRNPEEDKQVEDVLEETPDFLQDTPEQERLWFEQRPPRDFDFNE